VDLKDRHFGNEAIPDALLLHPEVFGIVLVWCVFLERTSGETRERKNHGEKNMQLPIVPLKTKQPHIVHQPNKKIKDLERN